MTTHPAAPPPRRAAIASRRCLSLTGALTLSALLAGCGAGSGPLVTVFTTGSGSVSVPPQCWNDQRPVDPQACEFAADKIGELDVQPGDTVGISVDQAVAEGAGWVPTIAGQRLVPTASTVEGSYYRFALNESTFEQAEGQALELVVYAVGSEPQTTRGLWVFQLTRRG